MSKLSRPATFKTRLMVANSTFMSILVYLIPVWGSAEKYLIKALQVMQNMAALCVTRLGYFTSTSVLLKQCNWLSISQLVTYHTALQVYRVRSNKHPVYMHEKYSRSFPYKTRVAAQQQIRLGAQGMASRSFICRSVKTWNSIPQEIRAIEKFSKFKKELKTWIQANISID